MTALFSGTVDVAESVRGMLVGAAAFTVYCLAVLPLVSRWGAWRGSAAALVSWALAATVGYLSWP